MFRIGICDDNKKDRDAIKEKSASYLECWCMPYEFVEFSSGEDLLEYCEKSGDIIDILFLDIEMGEMDGIEVKDRLNCNSCVQHIAFVTGHPEKMLMAFGPKVMAFIQKPVNAKEFRYCMTQVIRKLEDDEVILYQGIEGDRYIKLGDIKYLKAEKDYTWMYLTGDKKPVWTKSRLKKWEEKLEGKEFVKVQRSFLVNMHHIVRMKEGVFIDGEEMPISFGREYKKSAKDMYLKYLGNINEKNN